MKLLLTLGFAFMLIAPAMAQEASYTAQDEIMLQECLQSANSDVESAGAPACIGIVSNACQEEPGGSSTLGIVACDQREQSWWDVLLNAHYEELQQQLEPDVFDSLKLAQRAWLKYRDAKCSFLYELWRDGTIRSVIHSSCMLDTTATRTIELGEALDRGD